MSKVKRVYVEKKECQPFLRNISKVFHIFLSPMTFDVLSVSYTHLDVYKRQISDRAELTFERLRYSFGGDRPSQTARLTLSPTVIQQCRLEPQYIKSGIPTAAPRQLTSPLQSLPPILYIIYRDSVSSCSKAPWGLSV